MNGKKFNVLALAVAATLALLAGAAGAADESVAAGAAVAAAPDAAPAGEAPGMPPEMQQMMDAYAKAGAPGTEHQALAAGAGKWEAKIKSWMDPNGPPMESDGTMVSEMILGGRYLKSDFSSTMMGHPFHGFSLTGYENTSQLFQSLWIDDMSTGLIVYAGKKNADGKMHELRGTYVDPVTGQPAESKLLFQSTGPDVQVMEMFEVKEGKDIKVMEVTYTRGK